MRRAEGARNIHGNSSFRERYGSMERFFTRVATAIATAAGQPFAFVLAFLIILVWGVTGPVFHFSDTWQLVVNTGTTIVTFLMVFLIQNSQNRDNAAIQVKLDELIRSSTAQNFYIGVEHLTDDELDEIRQKCEERAAMAEEAGRRTSHRMRERAEDAADNA